MAPVHPDLVVHAPVPLVWNGTWVDLARTPRLANGTHWFVLPEGNGTLHVTGPSEGLPAAPSEGAPFAANPLAIIVRGFLEPAVGAAALFLAASYAPWAAFAHWAWDFGDGTTGSGPEASHAYAVPGNYTVRLVATDAQGTSTTTWMPLRVLPTSQAVTIHAWAPTTVLTTFSIRGPIHRVSPGDPVTFTAQPLGPVTDGTTFHWEFGDGGSADGREVMHTYSAEGDYTVGLTMTRPDGSADSATRDVQARRSPPTVQLWSMPTFPGQELRALAWDADGTIVSYDWDLGNGTHLAGQRITLTRPGTYNVTVTVTDDDGLTASAATTVVIHPNPPTVFAMFASSLDGEPRTYQFGASANDPDGGIVAYSWEFGDGSTSDEPDPVHTYAAGGNYVVTLTVTDGDGLTGSGTRTVLVPE